MQKFVEPFQQNPVPVALDADGGVDPLPVWGLSSRGIPWSCSESSLQRHSDSGHSSQCPQTQPPGKNREQGSIYAINSKLLYSDHNSESVGKELCRKVVF